MLGGLRHPLPSSNTTGGDSRAGGEGTPPLSLLQPNISRQVIVPGVPGATRMSPPQIQRGASPIRSHLLFLSPTPGLCWGAREEVGGGGDTASWVSQEVSITKPNGGHPAFPQRPLYPTLQTLSPVLAPGSAGVPSHSLAGFPFLAPAQAGKSWPLSPGTAWGSEPPWPQTPPQLLLTLRLLLGRVWGWRGPAALRLPAARPHGMAAPTGHGSAGVRMGDSGRVGDGGSAGWG